jgi:hypothetical protein
MSDNTGLDLAAQFQDGSLGIEFVNPTTGELMSVIGQIGEITQIGNQLKVQLDWRARRYGKGQWVRTPGATYWLNLNQGDLYRSELSVAFMTWPHRRYWVALYPSYNAIRLNRVRKEAIDLATPAFA